MLLSISTTHQPATDIGYLLGKHPQRSQSHALSFGTAHVCFSSASEQECTVALLVDLDPIGLIRDHRSTGEFSLGQYVNDRPYTASSFLSVAIARVFSSALQGESKSRAELAKTEIDLVAKIPVIYVDGGEPMLRSLFEPLGYTVGVERLHHTNQMFAGQPTRYYAITLTGKCTVKALLTHLYVLLPVLDDEKHYWVGDDEVQKLLLKGESWLANHPMYEQITARYLKHQRPLIRDALSQLQSVDEAPLQSATINDPGEEALELRTTLNEQRIAKVVELVCVDGVRSVIDLGCGEGRVLQALRREKQLERIAGTDVSTRALQIAEEKLDFERMSPKKRERFSLFQSSLTYTDQRFVGYDAAICIEVIEHLDASRLRAFERTVFGCCRAPLLIVSTPNAEYNVRYEGLKSGFRHHDHRFEWTRAQFAQWALSVCETFGYTVEHTEVGELDPELGAPTQIAVFRRTEVAQ